jgi:hypothetical protein
MSFKLVAFQGGGNGVAAIGLETSRQITWSRQKGCVSTTTGKARQCQKALQARVPLNWFTKPNGLESQPCHLKQKGRQLLSEGQR